MRYLPEYGQLLVSGTLTVLSIAQECHSTCYVCGPCRHTALKLLSPEEVVQRQPLIETLPYPG